CTWRAICAYAHEGDGGGSKNVLGKDSAMLRPEQTVSEVDPATDLVTYRERATGAASAFGEFTQVGVVRPVDLHGVAINDRFGRVNQPYVDTGAIILFIYLQRQRDVIPVLLPGALDLVAAIGASDEPFLSEREHDLTRGVRPGSLRCHRHESASGGCERG